MCDLNILDTRIEASVSSSQNRGVTTEELKKIHMPDIQDSRSVPFDVPVAYATGGGTPYGR
jgi:hypothetical protein